MWLIILFLTLIPILVYKYLIKPHRFWSDLGVVQEKPMMLFGNMYEITFQIVNNSIFMQQIYEKHSAHRYLGIYVFNQPVLLLRDMELIKRITIKDADSFEDHQMFANEEIDPLWSRNLFASKGQRWHQLRTTLSPAFTSSKMKMMFTLLNDCAGQFVQYFVEQAQNNEIQELEMKQMFTRYTNDVIATCAFGVTCDSLREPENELYVQGLDVSDFSGLRGLKFMLYSISPGFMKFFNIKIINDKVGNFFRKILKDTIHMREEKNIRRPDMVQLMMDMRKKVGSDQFTDDDMTAQAVVFFIAGFESSSILMSFVAYELAVNPELQERVVREIAHVLSENNGELTYDGLMNMKYLDMFINETLRKWPPTPFMDRIVTKRFYLEPERPHEKGVWLEEGQAVWVPVYQIHRDARLFENPDKFDPERFNDENKAQSNTNFLAFGTGPRICLGSRFALMETKAIIVRLLQEFEIVPVAKTNIPMRLDKAQMTLYSDGGWWVGFKRRQNKM